MCPVRGGLLGRSHEFQCRLPRAQRSRARTGGDGSWAMLHRDVDVTASLLDAEHPGDGAAWRALVDQWQRIGPSLVDALVTPFPPLGPGLRAMIKLPRVGGLSFVRQMLAPASVALEREFGGDAVRLLLTGNALHADIPLDGSGSGFLGLLLIMLGQTVGFPVPEGGAGKLSEAMRDRFVEIMIAGLAPHRTSGAR